MLFNKNNSSVGKIIKEGNKIAKEIAEIQAEKYVTNNPLKMRKNYQEKAISSNEI